MGPQIGSCGKCSECSNSLEQYCSRIIGTYNSKDVHGNPTYGTLYIHLLRK